MNNLSIALLLAIGFFAFLLLGGIGISGLIHAKMPPIPTMQRSGQPLP